MALSRLLASRSLRCALALTLVAGMAPSAALAAPVRSAGSTSAAVSAPGATPSVDSASSGAAADIPSVEGQALVLYRASSAGEDAVGARALGDGSSKFEEYGISVLQTWDFSAVDEAQERGVLTARAVDGADGAVGSAVPSGDDVRVALVSQEGASTDDLISQLTELDGVEAAQPNYELSIDEDKGEDALAAYGAAASRALAAGVAATAEGTAADGSAAGEGAASPGEGAPEGDAAATGSAAPDAVGSARLQPAVADESSAAQVADEPSAAQPAATSPQDDPYYRGWQGYLHEGPASIDLDAALAARAEAQASGALEENVVAVIDTGVDVDNPDLVDNLWTNDGIPGLPGTAGSHGYDFAEGDDDPRPAGVGEDSHGTHCAGIIAAATGNGEGIAGASSDTKVMALKVAPDGSSVPLASSVVAAYQYVVAALLAGENVVAVNNSYNAGFYQPVLDYLVNQAGRAGALSLFAAMNNSTDASSMPEYASTIGLQSPFAVAVASSNAENALSSFSNYNETAVDVAAPGSNILSTVSTRAAAYYFQPVLSHQVGKALTYYQDFSDYAENPSDYSVLISRSDGQDVPASDYEAVKVSAEADVVAGESGLRVTVDAGKLSVPLSSYVFQVVWSEANPFAGTTDAPSDYAIGLTAAIDTEVSPKSAQLVGVAQLATRGDTGVPSLAASGTVLSMADNYGINSTAVSQTNPDHAQASFGVALTFADARNPAASSGVYSGVFTGVGIGKVAGAGVTPETGAYVPYALQSGTSMATPLLAGSVAQLAAIHPDASALELRGMTVGGTVPISDAAFLGVEKHTATDGRFDWNAALDPASVSANTWSLEADSAAGTVTVYGYALGDAQVAFDGVAMTPTVQSDDAVTFAVPAEAFDGEQHRVDVTDASTGRVYRASYKLPVRTAHATLERVAALPEVAGGAQASGVLVNGGDVLYLADSGGSYLYRAKSPEDGAWTKLAAPPALPDQDFRSSVVYGARGGKLFAVVLQGRMEETGLNGLSVLAAVYDVAQDAWTPFKEVEQLGGGYLPGGTLAGACDVAVMDDGRVFATVSFFASDVTGAQQLRTHLYEADAGSDELLPVGRVTAGDASDIAVMKLVPSDGTLRALAGVMSDVSANKTTLHALAYDADAGAWTDEGALVGAAPVDDDAIGLSLSSTARYGSGVVVSIGTGAGSGDVAFVDFSNLTWTSLGSYGTSAYSSGTVIASLAEFDGEVYANAFDATTDGEARDGALYRLPYLALEQASGQPCPTEDYADVDRSLWYHEGVDWAVRTQVMTGYGDQSAVFGPDDDTTRAQMAQVLYNLAQRPAVTGDAPFADCEPGAWYDDAVAWAAGEGLVKGYEDGSGAYGPDDALTREQLATMLWRLAGEPAGAGDLSAFPDGGAVSAWAHDAVVWAVGEGVLQGYADSGLLDPAGEVTRAQLATILMRLSERDIELRSLALPEA